jgi:hypothetical protein
LCLQVLHFFLNKLSANIKFIMFASIKFITNKVSANIQIIINKLRLHVLNLSQIKFLQTLNLLLINYVCNY